MENQKKSNVIKQTLDKITKYCLVTFNTNLVSLYFLGSNNRDQGTPYSDFDFVLILKEYSISQLLSFRKRLSNRDFKIDFAIIFLSDLPKDIDNFRIGDQGQFFLKVIEKSSLLFGEDWIKRYRSIPSLLVKKSLYDNIARYWLAIQRLFIEESKSLGEHVNYQANKRTIKALYDLIWIRDGTQSEFNLTLNSDFIKQLFTPKEIVFIDYLLNQEMTKKAACKQDLETLKLRMNIMHKIYKKAGELINDNI